MNERFRECVEGLDASYRRLIEMRPAKVCNLPDDVPQHGVYLFSENGKHLYVGRSKNIRNRLQVHCRPSSRHNAATFAFLLASKETGRPAVTYKTKGGRKELEGTEPFKSAFVKAKEKVRQMDVRFIEEPDSVKQALLEIYIAVSLNTPFNDFKTT
ncbi:MAG: GIY-YIG nuclease family protein [Candidatus Brocadiia bacterium]